MKIEELFDNEKWAGYGIVVTDDANQTIEYLKTEVMEYVAGLQKRIAELEAQLPKKPKPTGVVHREYHAAVVERLEQRIAELIEVLSDIVLGSPIDDCNRDGDGLNAHPRNMERCIERAKSILKKEGGKW